MNITALSLSPAFPCDNTVFVATDGFGMYRTTEGNREDGIWYPINAGIGDLGVLSLAVSPNYNRCDRASQFDQGDSTLFVGTKSGRIYKSADGGATWTPTASGLPAITAPPNYSIAALAISPNYTSDSTLYASIQSAAAGGPNGVFRSSDGGSVWLPFDAGLSDRTVQAFALSANYANDTTLFVGTRFSGVFRFAGRLSQPSTATGSTLSQQATSAEDHARLQQISFPFPSMRLVATAAGALDGQIAYSVPGPVIFNYLVTNNGNETLSSILVIDGGQHSLCGDDPNTVDVDESIDDTLVGTIASLGPGQERTLSATFLVRAPSGAGGTDVEFAPKTFAGCASGDSITAGTVRAQDDAVVQLVVWTSITRSNSEMSDLWIWSFAVSPFFANDQTVFAGSAFGGLFKSSNAGSATPSWKQVNSGLEPQWVSVRAIALSPRYPLDHTLYVGTERGIFKGVEGADGSVAWTRMNQGLLRLDARALAISPNFLLDHVLFAGVWGNDLYRLRNGGGEASWIPQRRFLNGLWVWATALTPDGVLLGGTWSSGPSWPGIIGRDVMVGTAGWEFPSLPTLPGGETTVLKVTPTYCAGYEIFAGTWDRGFFRSLDAGKSWTALPLPTNLPVRSIAFSPNYAQDNTIYVASWGTGIYRSFDRGLTWGQLNAGLTDLLVRSVLIPPTFPVDGVVYAGTDNAGVFRWDPARNTWSPANGSLSQRRIMDLAVSPQYATDGTLAAATWGGGVALSQDRAQTWTQASSGLGSMYVRTVVFSPTYATDSTLYAGTISGAFRTSNRGGSWGLMGAPEDDLFNVDITSFSITAAPGQPRTIFASTGGKGIWQYTEAGTAAGLGGVFKRLASHGGASLNFHSFLPIAPKNRQGNIC